MSDKVCPECGRAIDNTPGWVKALVAVAFIAFLIGIGYSIDHLAWVV